MLRSGFGIYDNSGSIVAAHAWGKPLIDLETVIGTKAWDHFEEPDRAAIKTRFSLALLGDKLPPIVARLEPDIYGTNMNVVCRMVPTGRELPVYGVFAAFELELASLSPTEREMARLLAEGLSPQEVAKMVRRSQRTVERVRAALVEGLGGTQALISQIRDIL